MKAIIFLLVLVSVALAQDKYATKYDNIDVDKILQNTRVLTNYIKCMLEEGSCTADARELKKTLPDALVTGCQKCNEKQKATAEKVITHLRTRRPMDWARLVEKYDPEGQFKKRFEAGQKV
ncbi:ejaculatory bulb-specific protein 3-like [Belonocnema kinseyi]|uniref:ejaculatory bulb-specific protein 3-like n=1 Tax=Belonocnema kinseyi TaxID=2817044 RepID=UPI00143CD5E5|nr:ejaculatory bulb-specific protein 3-like [Belonocnema kinseyi]